MAEITQQRIDPASLAGQRSAGQRLRQVLGPDWTIALPFIVPVIILMGGLIAFPFFEAIRLSFTARSVKNVTYFVGLQNYRDLLHDSFFKQAVRNTIVFTTYSEIFKVTAGLIAALILHNLKRGRAILTGMVLLPWIVPTVVTALTWRSIFDSISGGLNPIISFLHLAPILQGLHLIDSPRPSWLGGTNLAMPSVIFVNVWKGIPFFTINFLAGLKAIDADLYEAAAVDGATAWQRFLNVTLPGLRYVILVTTLLSTIWTFNSFDVIYLLTTGGPGNATNVFSIFAYQKGIVQGQFGAGAAVALLMVPIIGVFIFFLARYMRRSDRQVEETALDRFFDRNGKTLLIVGVVGMMIFLYKLEPSVFLHAFAILGVILGIGFGFGWISTWLADRGEALRHARGVTQRASKDRPNILSRLPMWIALAILLFIVLSPFYWMVITTFKSDLQAQTLHSILWPSPWTTIQIHNLLREHPFWTWFRNTIIVAGCTTIVSVTFASLAGYALARLRFRGAQSLTGILLLTYLIPGSLLFIPLFQIMTKLRLINTLGALIVTYPTFALPFASWLLMGYFRNIPEELENAAMIDGATRFQAFRRITLPLAKPALLAVALFTFTNAWNEFLFAFVFTTDEKIRTLPVGLQTLTTGDTYPYGQLMAGAILMAVPVAVIYSYAQRFLVEGLTAGSVKG